MQLREWPGKQVRWGDIEDKMDEVKFVLEKNLSGRLPGWELGKER